MRWVLSFLECLLAFWSFEISSIDVLTWTLQDAARLQIQSWLHWLWQLFHRLVSTRASRGGGVQAMSSTKWRFLMLCGHIRICLSTSDGAQGVPSRDWRCDTICAGVSHNGRSRLVRYDEIMKQIFTKASCRQYILRAISLCLH